MEFVALDFETANEKRYSPCEVSVVRFSNGKAVDKYSTLIKPHRSVSFLPRNTLIHGITSADVKDSPEFADVLPEIISFIDQSLVVAHGASFDISVLRRTAELYDLQLEPKISFLCSRVLAERDPTVQLTSYSLASLCSSLGIHNLQAHRAESDAIACAQATERLASSAGFSNLFDYSSSLGVTPGHFASGSYESLKVPKGNRFPSSMSRLEAQAFLSTLPESEIQEDPDFAGKEVVFTGKLISMERLEAQAIVLKAGGTTSNSITKRTSLVVVGAPYDSELLDESRISGKLQKVMNLRDQGADIEVVTEGDFLRMIAE